MISSSVRFGSRRLGSGITLRREHATLRRLLEDTDDQPVRSEHLASIDGVSLHFRIPAVLTTLLLALALVLALLISNLVGKPAAERRFSKTKPRAARDNGVGLIGLPLAFNFSSAQTDSMHGKSC